MQFEQTAGRIVAKLESGSFEGGYDSISPDPGAGGWTYGKYQLASDVGAIGNFMHVLSCTGSGCLPNEFQSIAAELKAAGGETEAREKSDRFISAWRRLSRDDRRMQQAQESYQTIVAWRPVQAFFESQHSIDLGQSTCGLREAAFSIKTQHKFESMKRFSMKRSHELEKTIRQGLLAKPII